MIHLLKRLTYWIGAAAGFGLLESLWVASQQKETLLFAQRLASFQILRNRLPDWQWIEPFRLLEVPTFAGFLRITAESILIYGVIGLILGLLAAVASLILRSWEPERVDGLHVAKAVAAACAMGIFGSAYMDRMHRSTTHLAPSLVMTLAMLAGVCVLSLLLYRFARGRITVALSSLLTVVWLVSGALALFFQVTAPSVSAAPLEPAGSFQTERNRWNIVLISIDTLRADHLSAYGYSKPTSPKLDAVANEGVLFENCTSTSAWTLPSHMSLMTSTYSYTHGATSQGVQARDSLPTLAQQLRAGGYRTYGVVANPNVSSIYGFERGFDEFSDGVGGPKKARPAEFIIEQAEEWVAGNGEDPFFLFMHLYDVHSPYMPSEPYRSQFVDPDIPGDDREWTQSSKLFAMAGEDYEVPQQRLDWIVSLYDAELREVDERLGAFFQFLEEQGVADSTIIAVVSDHGEEFKEHGSLHHGTTVYEEMVRIPCFYRVPGESQGIRVGQPVSLIDMAPTLLDLVGIPAASTYEGYSLAPLAAGELDLYGRATFAETTNFLQRKTMVRDQYKLIVSAYEGDFQLFDLSKDPGETKDLSAELPDVLESMKEEFYRWVLDQADARRVARNSQSEAELSVDVEEQLRALGYL